MYNGNFYFNYGANTDATKEGSLLEYFLGYPSSQWYPEWYCFNFVTKIPQGLNGNITNIFKEVRGDAEQRHESPFLSEIRPLLQIQSCRKGQDPMVQAAAQSTFGTLSTFSLFLR